MSTFPAISSAERVLASGMTRQTIRLNLGSAELVGGVALHHEAIVQRPAHQPIGAGGDDGLGRLGLVIVS